MKVGPHLCFSVLSTVALNYLAGSSTRETAVLHHSRRPAHSQRLTSHWLPQLRHLSVLTSSLTAGHACSEHFWQKLQIFLLLLFFLHYLKHFLILFVTVLSFRFGGLSAVTLGVGFTQKHHIFYWKLLVTIIDCCLFFFWFFWQLEIRQRWNNTMRKAFHSKI